MPVSLIGPGRAPLRVLRVAVNRGNISLLILRLCLLIELLRSKDRADHGLIGAALLE